MKHSTLSEVKLGLDLYSWDTESLTGISDVLLISGNAVTDVCDLGSAGWPMDLAGLRSGRLTKVSSSIGIVLTDDVGMECEKMQTENVNTIMCN